MHESDLFVDRSDAGAKLARALARYAHREDVLVLALPRGGVPVAFEVVKALQVPMDILLVRKLGVPGHEELAMGALASGGIRVRMDDLIRRLDVPEEVFDQVLARQEKELRRRERELRSDKPELRVEGLTLIVVDDGLATGATMRAAVMALRKMNPGRIIVAVPVGSSEACEAMHLIADETVCLLTPKDFYAVGYWYRNFTQTTDREVRNILESAKNDMRQTTKTE